MNVLEIKESLRTIINKLPFATEKDIARLVNEHELFVCSDGRRAIEIKTVRKTRDGKFANMTLNIHEDLITKDLLDEAKRKALACLKRFLAPYEPIAVNADERKLGLALEQSEDNIHSIIALDTDEVELKRNTVEARIALKTYLAAPNEYLESALERVSTATASTVPVATDCLDSKNEFKTLANHISVDDMASLYRGEDAKIAHELRQMTNTSPWCFSY